MNDPAASVRRQLTLFVPQSQRAEIEAVRELLDPVQFSLIAAHVTLCREDELTALAPAELHRRLDGAQPRSLTLRFGRPEQFMGHGIFLHCVEGENEFQALRARILGPPPFRIQRPHLTLAHPRNPKSPGNSLDNARRLRDDIVVVFSRVCLIEQASIQPWAELDSFEIRA